MNIDIFYFTSDSSVMIPIKDILKHFQNVSMRFMSLEAIPNDFYDKSRRQYRADYLNMWLSKLSNADVRLGIIDVDGYVRGLNFVFGVATPHLMTATVFLPRLRYDVDVGRFHHRIKKEVLHELGHLFGLEHCDNPRCVMSFSNSIMEVDYKEDKYCDKHFKKLLRYGLKIDESILLT
jgi:archaemetzincin